MPRALLSILLVLSRSIFPTHQQAGIPVCRFHRRANQAQNQELSAVRKMVQVSTVATCMYNIRRNSSIAHLTCAFIACKLSLKTVFKNPCLKN